jgi:syndecan 2
MHRERQRERDMKLSVLALLVVCCLLAVHVTANQDTLNDYNDNESDTAADVNLGDEMGDTHSSGHVHDNANDNVNDLHDTVITKIDDGGDTKDANHNDNNLVADEPSNAHGDESLVVEEVKTADDYSEDDEGTAAGANDAGANEDVDNEEAAQEIDEYDSVESDVTTQQVPIKTLNNARLIEILKKPGILAGVIGGCVIGLLTAILLIMFVVYRMRKKDEGSYALEDTKKPLSSYEYRNVPTKEFYA